MILYVYIYVCVCVRVCVSIILLLIGVRVSNMKKKYLLYFSACDTEALDWFT